MNSPANPHSLTPADATTGKPAQTTPPRRRRDWFFALAWILVGAAMLPWGLPDKSRDATLFGNRAPWNAAEFHTAEALAARSERHTGADTDLDPLVNRAEIIELTSSDADRAQILRRYRLFSRQPDEMITFMALQRMKPRAGDLDPRLYQYGGAWIFGVGGALGLCGATGLATIRSDTGIYLESPELFGRFYLVARALALVSGALLLVGATRIARRIGGDSAAVLTALSIAVCPVFLAMSLEAKPHMPSVCLIVWATLAGLRYAQSCVPRDALLAGAAAGGAVAMVLSGAVAATLWPALWLVRRASDNVRRNGRRTLVLAGLVGAGVFAFTNPYFIHNALFDRAALGGNLGNSTAMYSVGRMAEGVRRVGELLIESAGPGVLALGCGTLVVQLARKRRELLLLLPPAGAMLAIAALIGAGKPAEFGRFLLLPIVVLAILAGAGAAQMIRAQRGVGAITALLVIYLSGSRTWAYAQAFATDAGEVHESRRLAAAFLEQHAGRNDTIGVTQEPAPYSVPPIDFAHRSVWLLPGAAPPVRSGVRLPDWLVLTADDASSISSAWWRPAYAPAASFADADPARITWANKPVFVFRRIDRSGAGGL